MKSLYCTLLVTTACAVALHAYAQSSRDDRASGSTTNSSESTSASGHYEDEYFSIRFPQSWRIARTDLTPARLFAEHPGVTQFPTTGNGVLLVRDGYTLALANSAGQTSGIQGGRFFEVFGMPWLMGRDISEVWDCDVRLREEPGPANNGQLRSFNIIFKSLDSAGRKVCGIPENLRVEGRWFAGYYSTTQGSWLFDGDGTNCPEKAYTLTTHARTPDQLPFVDDPALRRVLNEAMSIVASIRYKRCAPLYPESR